MQAKLFLFAVKKNEEDAVFSHLTLGESVSQVLTKFNEDLTYIVKSISDTSSLDEVDEVSKILNYFNNCSLWCLGSIDFITGELVPYKEEHFKLCEKLEVLQDATN